MLKKWISEHKKLRSFVLWVLALLLLAINIGISFNPSDNGGCISVTFDKLPMLLAQKAILRMGDKTYSITDVKLVHEIVSETIVATNTDLRYAETDRWIDIYCGNFIVRKIHWLGRHDTPHMFIVYNTSPIHWILFSKDGDGIVFPSDGLIAHLEKIVTTG